MLSDIYKTYNWTLAELHAFCLICECQNLSQAALRIGISQSAISLMVQRWRQALGDPLFVRARYGVAPTQIAIALREKLQPLLEEVGIALTQTQGFIPAQSTRVFKVHMTDIGQLVFLPGLNNFVAKHAPGIRLVIKNLGWESLESGLSSGEIDLAIGSLPMIKGRVHSRVFRHERYVTAMRKGHPLARNELDLEAFVAADHLAIDATSSGHSLVENALRSLDMRRNISLTIPHYLAAEQILVNSNYLLTVPNVAVLSFQDPAALCIVPTPLALPSFDVRVHWHERSRQDEGVRWLRTAISDLFGQR
ncbi:LysR family transcriptional regulator [Alcaligenes sp. DN25]|uniref:LysR family transcriptional regulator n=1 Tax=Alcaligenes TaxID=507 RepID=UPI00052DDD75|nr:MULTISPECIES: LysR family transcriptional regulator [Alcaligenes]KGP03531.1 LysR family transcriptional regulator [Alcaligenes faecalis]URW83212.1 LysR family transcriptional regulator [Alcaligenes sp. DN25]WEA68042.1 LysR family transcriptional regulator [Alcaligenes faecalis]